MSIKAIETRYAGCRFRSRLEARWAVFFDFIGTRWEYEPQGYEIGFERDYETSVRFYLPDFYLPDEDVWVEVKGRTEDFDLALVAAAVIPHGGCLPGSRFLLLGSIPADADSDVAWPFFSWHKGDIFGRYMAFTANTPSKGARRMLSKRPLQKPRGSGEARGVDLTQVSHLGPVGNDCYWTIAMRPEPRKSSVTGLRSAYTAARSARFEHGESGFA